MQKNANVDLESLKILAKRYVLSLTEEEVMRVIAVLKAEKAEEKGVL